MKFHVTLKDKHGDQDVVDVYADNFDAVVDALDDQYGDDYTEIVSIDQA